MSQGGTFETKEPYLVELLRKISQGRIQLPDFQRGWVWDDGHIRSLLASVTLSYPIGAVMLLETGSETVRFKPRLFEGVSLSDDCQPERLALDGQQRLTSLYLAIASGQPVPTRTEKRQEVQRLYYLDMEAALDPERDREEAVVSIPSSRQVTSDFGRKIELDLSEPHHEYARRMYPFHCLFDQSGAGFRWESGYREHYQHSPESSQFLMRFQQQIVIPFQQYRIPVIELLKQTPKEAVCQVFEKVNTGGVSLTVFELVTASFAAEDFLLREDWNDRAGRLRERKVLESIDASDFLTAATLLTTYERSQSGRGPVSCKRKDILERLDLEAYRQTAPRVEDGFRRASEFLATQKVYDSRNLPYKTQLVPLAVVCALLGMDYDQDLVRDKLARWYWCGVFGELYGGSTDARFAFDVPELCAWIRQPDGPLPRTVQECNFAPTRLLSMQTGGRDFMNGDDIALTTYFDLAVDIHHVFPADYCKKSQLPERQWNSAVNKTPLTSRTNRRVGGHAPSHYLQSLIAARVVDQAKLDPILRSHLIDPGFLWADDFSGFLRSRAAQLLSAIERATGKEIPGLDSDEVRDSFGGPLLRADPASTAAQG